MSAAAEIKRLATGTVVREATAEDAGSCARIFYDAFESIATQHNFPVEPPSRDFTDFKVSEMLSSDGFFGLVAEREGELLGSAFVDERAVIAGIGPVTVDPAAQDDGIGRALVEAALDRERDRGIAGVRLVQTAYHYRSLALYAKLGFVVREALSVLQGTPPAISMLGRGVRAASDADLARCSELCVRVHGHDRTRELQDAVTAGTARVVERPSGVCGYATGFGYGWHAVAETNEDLIALLSSAEAFMGLGILVPSQNAELLRWGLEHGLRIVQQSTLMTIGLYNEPAGAYLPSILF
ncbi:MAG: GNAT family N-acetyltransferase [Solirubrobacterales bacterium]|nr:GNAT family N-acetyltransferase [Solirubrobacterales bacterium]